MVTWMVCEYMLTKKINPIGAACGAIAGLVAITPACGFVEPIYALVIGFGSGVICYFTLLGFKKYIKIDDALDVFSIHGVGGIWGSIATGLFATSALGGTTGMIEGNMQILLEQLIAVGTTIAYSFIVTFLILFILKITVGLRTSILEEANGIKL